MGGDDQTSGGGPGTGPGHAPVLGSVFGPVLGIDLGTKRIGLAVSDAEGCIAFPAGFLASRGRKRDLRELCDLIRNRGITRVVVGYPIHMDGSPTTGSQAAKIFANELAKLTGLPVELVDERWTTRAAEQSLRESRRGRSKRREAVDSIAATFLLRTWLEQHEAVREAQSQ